MGQYSGFHVLGMSEGFFGVWNFPYQDFFLGGGGTKIWQVLFWVAFIGIRFRQKFCWKPRDFLRS